MKPTTACVFPGLFEDTKENYTNYTNNKISCSRYPDLFVDTVRHKWAASGLHSTSSCCIISSTHQYV